MDSEFAALWPGRSARTCDPRVSPRLLSLAADPDEAVRLSIASSLPMLLDWDEPEPPEIIDALIVLTSDPVDEVRNWATFGLGEQTHADGPDVRAALLARTTDSFQDAREEGVCGLARRRDPRGIALLHDQLAHCPLIRPDGGWSLLIDTTQLGLSPATATQRLFDRGRIAATAMNGWGPTGERYLRLVFTNEPADRLRDLRHRFNAAFG